MLRFFVFIFVLYVPAYAYSGCEGWSASAFICESTPVDAASESCAEFADWTGLDDLWKFYYFENISIEEVSRFEYKCATYLVRADGTHWITGGTDGYVIFFACPSGEVIDPNSVANTCYKACDKPLDEDGKCPPEEPTTCPTSKNPINFLTGNKLFTEIDYDTGGVNRLFFSRKYNSHNNKDRSLGGGWLSPDKDLEYFKTTIGYSGPGTANVYDYGVSASAYKNIDLGYQQTFLIHSGGTSPDYEEVTLPMPLMKVRSQPLGAIDSVWRHSFQNVLIQSFDTQHRVVISRYSGDEYVFLAVDGLNTVFKPKRPEVNKAEQIIKTNQGFTYTRNDLTNEYYDLSGKYLGFKKKNGYEQTLTYNEFEKVESVSDSFGRTLTFEYDISGRMSKMITPEGYEYGYQYNAKDLMTHVFYPDDDTIPFNTYRQYFYEDARFPNAVTSIEENGKLYGSFAYNSEGKAIYSELANSAEAVSVDYSVASQRHVVNALGKVTIYHYDVFNNLVEIEGEPSTNCAGSSRNFSYDSNNFKISETDRNGNVTTYVRDADGREISRTEASGTPQARTIETEWHSTLNVKTKITEPGRITHFTYDTNGLLLNKSVTPNPAP